MEIHFAVVIVSCYLQLVAPLAPAISLPETSPPTIDANNILNLFKVAGVPISDFSSFSNFFSSKFNTVAQATNDNPTDVLCKDPATGESSLSWLTHMFKCPKCAATTITTTTTTPTPPKDALREVFGPIMSHFAGTKEAFYKIMVDAVKTYNEAVIKRALEGNIISEATPTSTTTTTTTTTESPIVKSILKTKGYFKSIIKDVMDVYVKDKLNCTLEDLTKNYIEADKKSQPVQVDEAEKIHFLPPKTVTSDIAKGNETTADKDRKSNKTTADEDRKDNETTADKDRKISNVTDIVTEQEEKIPVTTNSPNIYSVD